MENTSMQVFTFDAGHYCSIKGDTQAEKVQLYNMLTSGGDRLGDHINETIEVCDLFISFVEITDKTSGEVIELPRIVLIDTDGKQYVAISKGIYRAVSNIVQIFGRPTWEPALRVKVRQKLSKNNNQFLSLDLE